MDILSEILCMNVSEFGCIEDADQETRRHLDEQLMIDPIDESAPESNWQDLSVLAAANALKVTPRHVQRLLSKGLLDGYKIDTPKGKRWRVRRSAVLNSDAKLDEIARLQAQLTRMSNEISDLTAQVRGCAIRNTQMDQIVQQLFSETSEMAGLTNELCAIKERLSQTEALLRQQSECAKVVEAPKPETSWWTRVFTTN